jgi:hypothetical protein
MNILSCLTLPVKQIIITPRFVCPIKGARSAPAEEADIPDRKSRGLSFARFIRLGMKLSKRRLKTT